MMDSRGVKMMILLMLLSGFSLSSAELLRPPQPPQYNYAFNKFRPPPPPEPSFFQRITSWIFPWGGVSSEEEFRFPPPASPKIDNNIQHRQSYGAPPVGNINPPKFRDTEPTTARTTPAKPITKCSPCNKVPWIPMMPTYQLPVVKPTGQHQVYFKHHFGNENQYTQVSPVSGPGYNYGPPSTTQPPITTPIKLQDGFSGVQGHQYYGVPPTQNVQFQGYQYSTPRATSYRPNTNTIDTSVVTFTTGRPQNNRPLRFTNSIAGKITNPEYLPPPNILPLENENSGFVPIPIPNLSPTPIPPLFNAIDFNDNPYTNQKTGFIKLVPLDPVAQVSNNVNVQVKPTLEFAAVKKNPAVEVIGSNLVADFTLRPQFEFFDRTTQRPVQQNHKFNFNIGNNLDANTTISSPIVVESLETATDSIGAGSEHDYEHNIHQALDVHGGNFKFSDIDTINTEESNRVFPSRDRYQDSDEATTTEGNYIVKFEPSLQTAADLEEEKKNKKEALPIKKNRNRLTPIELLDSPIFHLTTFTAKPPTTVFTRPPPLFKPIEDFTKKLATLWTSPVPISTSTDPTTTPVYRTIPTTTTKGQTTTPAPITPILSQLSSGIFGDITPPREPTKPPALTKKPKQIQIVIPYTTFNKPSPFKVQEEQELITYRPIRGHYVTHPTKTRENEVKSLKDEESFNGHGYHNDQEYPDAQESKIVESKVTIAPSRTTKYLTKILANNIHDLLRKEKTPKPSKASLSPRPPRIDIIKLQKNIDGWTEQSFKGKASTISLMGHTKSIPRSFLSTTMKTTTFMALPTTTLSPKTTFDPDLMEETKRQYDSILYKKNDDLLYVKRHDRFLDRDNELVLINNNLTYGSVNEGVRVFAPKTTLTPKELWKRLHFTVSPLTNEKIYVVTPQPQHETEKESVSTFRPRFAVRPTVAGKVNLIEAFERTKIEFRFTPASKKQAKKLKPEMFDRIDDQMELETIDGDEKVIL